MKQSAVTMRKFTTRMFLSFWLVLCTVAAGNAAPATAQYQSMPGFNLPAVTHSLAVQYGSAFPLLSAWKNTAAVTAIESYDPATKTMLRAEINADGLPTGADFPLSGNGAIYAYGTGAALLDLGQDTDCSERDLSAGLNLISSPCMPAGYTAKKMIDALGAAAFSVSRFDAATGRWQTAARGDAGAAGEDFALVPGEGYQVVMAAAQPGWVPLANSFSFVPSSLTTRQGATDAILELRISSPAPAGGITANLLSSNTAQLSIPASAFIPEGAAAVAVPLTPILTNGFENTSVSVTTTNPEIGRGTATVLIRPSAPVVNISPATVTFAASEFFSLHVNLSDPAPAGGLVVNLAANPTATFQLPASVTIPAGASSARFYAKVTSPGSYTVTAAAAGYLSGPAANITIVPCITTDYGPLLSAPVGVKVQQEGAHQVQETYTPVLSLPIGIAVGAVITGITPNHGAIGDSGLLVRIDGRNLATASGVTFLPADGITIRDGSFVAAADGNSVQVVIDITPTATTAVRTVLLNGIEAMPAAANVNQFRVTHLLPVIDSMAPITREVGTIFTLTLRGSHFFEASSVQFTPADGILVNNPPAVSADGTNATVTVILLPQAAPGQRAVTITTPAGSSPSSLSARNTFTVTSLTGEQYSPLLSAPLGVMVTPAGAQQTTETFTPVISLPVGIAVGPVITAVNPSHGAIGDSGLVVKVEGHDLAAATGLSFFPADGITIRDGSFSAAPDGSFVQVTIDIAENAPVNVRTVMLGGINALAASPYANTFNVTLKLPVIDSITPITREVGSTFTLTLRGRNFGSASAVQFLPPDGVQLNNPPAINADGTIATVTVITSANAPLGPRAVTITTPGGTSDTALTARNTFTLTALPGDEYSPLLSSAVGVWVQPADQQAAPPTVYAPVVSIPVGVYVTPDPPPAVPVTYTPVNALPTGVVVGNALAGIVPKTMEPGTSATVTVTGVGLDTVTAASIFPAENMTISNLIPAADGQSLTMTITADGAAIRSHRRLMLQTASGGVPPVAAGVDIFLVGPKPSIEWIDPIIRSANSTFEISLFGENFQESDQVTFLGAGGVLVNNPPSVSSDGISATVKVILEGGAPCGERTVVISSPYGSSDTTRTVKNTFTVCE